MRRSLTSVGGRRRRERAATDGCEERALRGRQRRRGEGQADEMDAAHDTGTRSATSSQCTAQSSQRCLAFLQRRAVLLPYSRAGSPSSLPASAAPCRPPILIQCCHAILLAAPATPHPSSPASTPTLPRCHSTSTPADPEERSMIAAFHATGRRHNTVQLSLRSHIWPPMARLLRLPHPILSSAAGHVDHGDAGGLHAAAPGAGHPNPHKPDCCLERRLQRCRRSDRRCRVGGAAPLCPVSGSWRRVSWRHRPPERAAGGARPQR